MNVSAYDLDPHTQLPWPHLTATVRRRFLVSYAVDPRLLADRLPPGAELTLAHGRAWVSACIVHTDDMRPASIPRALGTGFRYLIHRPGRACPIPTESFATRCSYSSRTSTAPSSPASDG